ncbi:MAG: ATP-dependent sacrificial sulfur transferase LarE [Paludisphaera borealis]|uniref:ATP-dependent sacrificial sulfur transferase LarE n=1 Tax=Paludisphaera borealis TaxID=1387353 RepID=UPI0028445ADE|nr:ATP-dependent sacrificial sulfur transferase LarE [Paludisphaera borealis]MDR3618718.1 ATP-dependent sacrificial sulfur transferase LarE [Paludisphaera borealis]
MSSSPWTATDPALAGIRDSLIQTLRGYGRVAVAYSGGIDSTVVARAAFEALGDAAVAVTAVSESLAQGELEEAESLAKQIGIRHRLIRTEEFADPNYLRNNSDRCYFCKSELYGRLSGLLGELGVDVIASGANTDDRGEHRPGMRAAGENGVRHPLQECELGKDAVRALAKAWGLPTWDKPATPCLSSRIAYGEAVTPERVRMIDEAEAWLRRQGLRLLRVRYHKNDMARIEVPLDELAKLAAEPVRSELVKVFRDLGFKFVALDLEGFRSGSLNGLIPLESLLVAPTARR